MPGNGCTDYSWWHQTPASGVIFYRIKAVEFSGEITYSLVVRVVVDSKTNTELIVYPNPVKGEEMNISASLLKEGKYDIIILNMAGQKVVQKSLNHSGGSISLQVNLPENIKAGLYSIKLSGGDQNFVKTFLVQ